MRSDADPARFTPVVRALLAVVVGAVVVVAGCAPRTTLETSAVALYPGGDYEFEFWDEVATHRVVTNDDALHGLLVFVDPALAETDYDGRLAAARARGWLPEGRTLPANESARVGFIAVAICDILEIDGGVSMFALGLTPRYCTRELVFRKVIPRRTENQSLSGLEFIDLVGRVEDRLGAG